MSAIAGIFFLDGRPVESRQLDRMVESLAHRGPDGTGAWSEGPIGLGQQMLHATPESLHEKLPLADRSRNCILTADARIDNRNELIAALGMNGRMHDEITDGALILGAYERWGERCPERLLGDFAFAIWDRRRQTLFCARDHMGVKPLYYHRSDRVLVFASEIKALLCVPEVPQRLDEERVADYLAPALEDETTTFYRDICRLPPAHRMTMSRDVVRLQSYWSLDDSREIRYSSDGEYAEAFREVFTEAVGCRLRSPLPIGSMLSGGLDSSAITCVARQMLSSNGNGRLQTFSAIFDDVPECDERPFINSVLAGGRLTPHYVHADRMSPLGDLDRVLHHEDEAFYAPNLFMHWGLHSAAYQQGVRVLLDGFDGDSTVSHGVGRLTELASSGNWLTLATEVNQLSKRFGRPPWKILLRFGIRPLAPEPARRAWRSLRGREEPTRRFDQTIDPDFARRINLAGRLRSVQGDRLRPARSSREEHLRALTSGLIPFALEVNDKSAAAFRIESRYPFFDKRLVELCLAMPPEQKLRQGWTRIVMRRALADTLPDEVRWRGGKSNLSPNFTRGLLAFERGLLEDVIYDNPQPIEEYVNLPALREAYRRYASRHTEADAMSVWRATTLALWLRRTGLAP